MRRIALPPSSQHLLEITGAASVAVAQPVLAVFADDPSTFVLLGASVLDIVVFAAVLTLAVPAALWVIGQGASMVSERGASLVRRGELAVLGAIAVAQLIGDIGAPRVVLVVGALVAAAAMAVAAELDAVRRALRLLATLAPALLAWFVLLSPVADVVREPSVDAVVQRPSTVDEHLSVLVVVFDELPTASLMRADGSINAELLPSFAALGERGTWFRNHSTGAPFTQYALPALVTGNHPTPGRPPLAGFYPDSMFTALAPTHELNVHEPERLCPTSVACRAGGRPDAGGATDLLDSAVDVLRTRVWPDDDGAPAAGPAPAADVGPKELLAPGQRAALAPDDVDQFIESLQPGERSRLDYLHVLSPHQPWNQLLTGQISDGPSLAADTWFGAWADGRAARAGLIRHLRTLRWTDAQLGRIVDRLADLDRLDSTIIVVTADHGMSFNPSTLFRASAPANVHETYWAPLFIAGPGLTPGDVVDDPVTAHDVVPTIAALAGIDLPYATVGAAIHDGVPRDRTGTRRVHAGADSSLRSVDGFATIDGDAAFRRLLEIAAGRSIGGPLDVHRQGPNGEHVGRRLDDVAELRVQQVRGSAAISDAHRFDEVDLDAHVLPLWVHGLAPGDGRESAEVVLTVDGVIAATPLARASGDELRYSAPLPLSMLHDGAVDVRAWMVVG